MRASWSLLLLLLLAGPVLAQTNADEGDSDDTATANNTQNSEETEDSDADRNQPPGGGSFEDFDPSEEISEDLSVPFPVDI